MSKWNEETLTSAIRWFGFGHCGAGLALIVVSLNSLPKWWQAVTLVFTSDGASFRDFLVVAAWMMIKLTYVLQFACGLWLALLRRGAWRAVMCWAVLACIAHAIWIIFIQFHGPSSFEIAFAVLTIVFFARRDVRLALRDGRPVRANSSIPARFSV